MSYAIASIIPELIVMVSALGLLMLGAFRGDRATSTAMLIAVGAVFASLAVVPFSELNPSALNGMLMVDEYGRFVKILILSVSGLSLLISRAGLQENNVSRPEYPVLILFATLGMMLTVSARDMMALYVGLELQSLPIYMLAAFRRDSGNAGPKYFALGALSSCILLYGISLLYGYAGATDFAAVASAIKAQSAPMIVIVAMVCVCIGFAFKISAVPFHMWAPDVYEGAPAPVTAFLAITSKIAAIALLARVLLGPFSSLAHDWQQMLMALSVASMVIGGFGGIAQNGIKRLMAYGAIFNVGFALMSLAVSGEAGIQVMLIYMSIYAVNVLGVFAVLSCVRRKGQPVDKIEDLSGFSQTHSGLAFAMAVFMFSLAGIPPLAGFLGRYFALLIAVNVGLLTLVAVGVLMSVIAAYYYVRIVKIMYFDEVAATAIDHETEIQAKCVAYAVAGLVGLFVLYPSPLVDSALVAAKNLLGS